MRALLLSGKCRVPHLMLPRRFAESCYASAKGLRTGLMLEQITWRGCRHDGGGIAAGAAVGHLQSALQAEGIRAAHECYAMTMPLAVPLPFPRIFAPGLSSMGDKV